MAQISGLVTMAVGLYSHHKSSQVTQLLSSSVGPMSMTYLVIFCFLITLAVQLIIPPAIFSG
jgi:hypothetical protein